MSKHNHITRDIKPLGQCPGCDEYHDRHIPKGSPLTKIKELMKVHDWYFNYSDDQREWRKGSAEETLILNLMRQIPMREIPALLELVPEELRAKWLVYLQHPERDQV